MNIKESKNIFCRNIHWRRKQSGMTLEELAERSGIPARILEPLERGVIPEEMMVGDALALARVFGCKTHELFQ